MSFHQTQGPCLSYFNITPPALKTRLNQTAQEVIRQPGELGVDLRPGSPARASLPLSAVRWP